MTTKFACAVALIALAGAAGLTATEANAQSASVIEAEQALPEGVTLVEVGEADREAYVPAYEKYRLDNGLTVVLHEDHSDPLVHVMVMYHVGSGREAPGQSGYAHLLEHLLFEGSENVPQNKHYEMVYEAGGTMNGSTNAEVTSYYQTVPSNFLEQMLWLEADRMGFILPAFDQEIFEGERAAVKNERALRYDNSPYGRANEWLQRSLYPPGHPYYTPTAGYTEDIDRATLDDVRAYFLRWYGPNNATLAIGGNLDRRQTLEWIAKYFGSIPTGMPVERAEKQPVTLQGDRFVSVEDKVTQPRMYVAFPTIYKGHPDEPALVVMLSLLANGKGSPIYERFEKSGDAQQARGFVSCLEVACFLGFQFAPAEDGRLNLGQLRAGLFEELDKFRAAEISQDDIDNLLAPRVASAASSLDSVASKVSTLAYHGMAFGDPGFRREEIARYRSITAADVRRVFDRYIAGKSALTMSIVPEGAMDLAAAPANYEMPPTTPGAVAPVLSPEMLASEAARRVPADAFDRSIVPDAQPDVAASQPETWQAVLPNGVKVTGIQDDELAQTFVTVRGTRGWFDQPVDKLGVAQVTQAMMSEATEDTSAEDLQFRERGLGTNISFDLSSSEFTMTVEGLSENLAPTMELAAEKFYRPALDEADFERVRQKLLESMKRRSEYASLKLGAAAGLALWGKESPAAYGASGREDIVEALTIEDVRSYYRESVRPSVSDIVVVSNLAQEDVLRHLGAFGQTATTAETAEPIATPSGLETGTIYLIDRPGSTQSVVRFTRHAPTYGVDDFYQSLRPLNYILGGYAKSRLAENLRAKNKLTYSVSSSVVKDPIAGTFIVSTDVDTDVTGFAVRQILDELSMIAKDGLTDEELEFTRSAITRAEARAYESASSKASIVETAIRYGLPTDYRSREYDFLRRAQADEVNERAKSFFDPLQMIAIIVGDAEKVRPQLEIDGWKVREVDEKLDPVDPGFSGDGDAGIE